MSDFFNKYPYTDFHELNIDWLLTEFKKLTDSYQEIIDWIENDARNFNILLNRIIALEDQTQTMQSQISAERIRVDAQFDNVTSEFSRQYDRITREYTDMYSAILTDVDSALSDLASVVYQNKVELLQAINDGDTAVRNWVEAYLQTFIENLPDYEQLIIYNPVQGIQTNVQTAINDLYDYFNAYALTAQQYDNLMLTADDYDSYGLTAHEYDSAGLQYLGAGFYLMRSPFTGTMAPIPTVINMLFDLHRTGALTASAYDALALDAAAYDALDLTAYSYDANGI